MSLQRTLITGGVLGAVAGMAVSYLYFTDEGREWRERLESNFDQLAREAEKLVGAVDQVRQGVAELRTGQSGQSGWSRTA